MIYVISDIHGCYDRYMEMLAKINFDPEDTLYVLGDVIDRGSDGFKTLLDMWHPVPRNFRNFLGAEIDDFGEFLQKQEPDLKDPVLNLMTLSHTVSAFVIAKRVEK